MDQDRPLTALMNIGETLAMRLHEIGVHTEQHLRTIGPITAHRLIKRKHPDVTLPLCYYLYSFDGALRNLHWNKIGETRKQILKEKLNRDIQHSPKG